MPIVTWSFKLQNALLLVYVFLVDFTNTVAVKFQLIDLIRDCLDFIKQINRIRGFLYVFNHSIWFTLA